MACSRADSERALTARKCCLTCERAFLDRIEIGRIGWQIQQPCAGGLDQLAHTGYFMRGQVIHHHAVPRAELRAQHLLQVGQEHISVRGCLDTHRGHPTRHRHGAQQRERAPAPGRHGVAQASPADGASPQPGHLRGDPTFIQENQVCRIDLLASLQPVRALETAPFGVLLGGVERLFFSRRPRLLSTIHRRDKLTSK